MGNLPIAHSNSYGITRTPLEEMDYLPKVDRLGCKSDLLHQSSQREGRSFPCSELLKEVIRSP